MLSRHLFEKRFLALPKNELIRKRIICGQNIKPEINFFASNLKPEINLSGKNQAKIRQKSGKNQAKIRQKSKARD